MSDRKKRAYNHDDYFQHLESEKRAKVRGRRQNETEAVIVNEFAAREEWESVR